VDRDDDFERFFREVEPRLRRAFVGSHGVDAAGDAVAEALLWAWRNWERVQMMTNPAGYLYRVGQSKVRPRRSPTLPAPETLHVPDVEPQLIPALLQLSPAQRTAVWLVHGCQWRYAEVAGAMDISPSAVGTHVTRGLQRLRTAFEVTDRA
jgi:DNA-directed RNA polymerase specialized sigma24 family protein